MRGSVITAKCFGVDKKGRDQKAAEAETATSAVSLKERGRPRPQFPKSPNRRPHKGHRFFVTFQEFLANSVKFVESLSDLNSKIGSRR